MCRGEGINASNGLQHAQKYRPMLPPSFFTCEQTCSSVFKMTTEQEQGQARLAVYIGGASSL